MRKRLISFFVCLCIFAFPCLHAAAEGLPMKTIAPPTDMTFVRSYPNEGNECIEAVFTVPDDLCKVASVPADTQDKYYGTAFVTCVQFDWAIDDETAFHYDESWDTTESDAPVRPITGSFVEQSEVLWFAYDADVRRCGDAVKVQHMQLPDDAQDDADDEDADDAPKTVDVYSFDFDAHTLYVRARFFVYADKSGECTFSDWSAPLDVAKNFGTGAKLSEKSTDAPVLHKAADAGDGVFTFDISFTDEFKETARILKSAFDTELNLESQVRVDGGEWNYWIVPDELYPYHVGQRQFSAATEDVGKKIEYRCRLSGGNPDFGTDVTTAWSDILTSENGKVRIAVNDDPFDEKAMLAQQKAAEKEANRCKLCGFCPVHPFGICMFVWLGVLALIALIVWYCLRSRKKKAAAAAEIEARRAASAQNDADKTKSFVRTDRVTLQSDKQEQTDETPVDDTTDDEAPVEETQDEETKNEETKDEETKDEETKNEDKGEDTHDEA